MNPLRRSESNLILKILVIGDSGVGKTNLITRYCQNTYKNSYVATIGIDFKVKKFTFDNFSLKLQIWDTAGQQRFKNMTNTFYKGAAGIIVAFSITDIQSFQNVSTWVKQINNSAEEKVVKLLVGTKSDLESERKVTLAEAQELGRNFNKNYIQLSSKTGTNVQQCFHQLITLIKQKYDEMDNPILSEHGVELTKQLNKNRRNCSC